jgi:hypothetical protein
MTDEMQTRAVGACWQFAAVFHATNPREQTCTNVNDLARETPILLDFLGSVVRS